MALLTCLAALELASKLELDHPFVQVGDVDKLYGETHGKILSLIRHQHIFDPILMLSILPHIVGSFAKLIWFE